MHAASSLEALDVHQPTTLYWKAQPVFTNGRTEQLTIRLISGYERSAALSRVLRIYLSSEADLLLLYVLDLTEADFAAIRAAENIRVDYANFPAKLIGLLEKCIACVGEDVPRFQAVLQAAGPQATFKVVENNDFKQVSHISLTFRPGSDAAVKQFLAFRLTELKADAGALSGELERTQSERNALQAALTEARRAAVAAKEVADRTALEHDADVKGREAAALAARTREVAELTEQHHRERAELESKYRGQLDVAEARTSELDAENRGLRELKLGLDARLSELSHKLGAAEGALRAAEAEGERLRGLAAQLGRDKAERDVELSEALARVAALQDKVAGQQGLVEEQAQRLRGLEAGLRQAEARAEELKAAGAGAEGREREAAAELAKANAAVERLSSDLQAVREKLRRKEALLGRQEEELAARDKAADEGAAAARSLRRELEAAQADAEVARGEAADLKSKLEESKKQLASNEQMIRWLNNQITDTQLHYGGAGAGAGTAGLGPAVRFGYRPGAPLPPVPSGTTASSASAGAPGVSAAGLGAAGAAGLPGSALRGLGTWRSPAARSPGSTTAASGLAPPGSGLPPPAPPTTTYRSSFYTSGYAPRTSSSAAAAKPAGLTPAPVPAAASGAAGSGGPGTMAHVRGSPVLPSSAAPPPPPAARSLNLGGAAPNEGGSSSGGLLGLASRPAPTYVMAGSVPVPVTSSS